MGNSRKKNAKQNGHRWYSVKKRGAHKAKPNDEDAQKPILREQPCSSRDKRHQQQRPTPIQKMAYRAGGYIDERIVERFGPIPAGRLADNQADGQKKHENDHAPHKGPAVLGAEEVMLFFEPINLREIMERADNDVRK